MRKHFLILLTCLFLICSMIGCSSRETASREENIEIAKGYLGQQVCDSVKENKIVIAESFRDINRVNVEAVINWIQTKEIEEALADYDMQDWEEAYAEFLEGYDVGGCVFCLIYVNDDDIPELAIDTRSGAGGSLLLTYYNGKIDECQTARSNFYYIERQNLVNNSDGHMGHYHDYVYSIEDGKWISIAEGNWTETFIGNAYEYEVEYAYEWNDEEVDKKTYEKRLNAVFNEEHQMRPKYWYYKDEMLWLLKTGKLLSDTHRYEFCVEDISWDEAEARCEEKGGYLANITSLEECERIQSQLENSAEEGCLYWIGKARNGVLYSCWERNDPISDHARYDGEFVYEEGIYFFYDADQKQYLLGDAPPDLLAYYPEYEGKIGYICEYGR